MTSDDKEKDEFYSRLNAVYESTPRGDIVVVMGDLNDKVGVGNSGGICCRQAWCRCQK